MKQKRIWFKKYASSRFISHLDLNRVMIRAIRRAKVPIWYTEGFNPHPFLTFSLPLSLGIIGLNESFDLRLLDDINKENMINEINNYLPEGIEVFDITEPVMKPKDIIYAEYKITISPYSQNTIDIINEFFLRLEIIIEKKSKSGLKQIDLKQCIKEYNIYKTDNVINIDLILPAGSKNNINPFLINSAFEKYNNIELNCLITRVRLLDINMQPFI